MEFPFDWKCKAADQIPGKMLVIPGSLESVAKEATVTVAPPAIDAVATVCSAAPDPTVDNSL